WGGGSELLDEECPPAPTLTPPPAPPRHRGVHTRPCPAGYGGGEAIVAASRPRPMLSHFPLYVTRYTTPLPSSLNSTAQSCAKATSTGRPHTFSSPVVKPTTKS